MSEASNRKESSENLHKSCLRRGEREGAKRERLVIESSSRMSLVSLVLCVPTETEEVKRKTNRLNIPVASSSLTVYSCVISVFPKRIDFLFVSSAAVKLPVTRITHSSFYSRCFRERNVPTAWDSSSRSLLSDLL